MKALAAVLGVVTVAIVGLAVFATVNLRTLIGAHQDELVARVGRMIGRPVTVGAVVPSWWPLGIRLRDVTVAEDPAFGAASCFTAESVVIGSRPWPLVAGRIEASGVHLERPRLALVRDAGGHWNVESLGVEGETHDERSGGSKGRRPGFRIPLEWVVGVALSQIAHGTVTIEDRRTGRAPIELRHVHLRATDVYLGATAKVRLEAALFAADAPDLRLDLIVSELGQHDAQQAPFTARVEVRDADLAVLARWLGGEPSASGRVRSVRVDAEGPVLRGRATVALEADDPALVVAGVPLGRTQPIAVTATVAGALDAIRLADVRATLGTLVMRAEGQAVLDPWRVALTVTSEPTGRATLALDRTALAIGDVDGTLALDRDGLALQPLRLHVDDAPFEVRGWVTDADPATLDVHVEGRPFDGTLTGDVAVDADGGARARVEAAAIDLALALPRFVPELDGRVEGRAAVGAVLTARLADGRLAPGSLAGTGTLAVAKGRLRDVNVPDRVVAEIEEVPLMPQLVSARTRARYAELFGSRDTVVESADVPFTIARGRFASDHVLLVNPAYQVSGRGWIDATDELRFTGTVLLGASVSRTLRDDVRAAKYLAADDGRISLPFVARGRMGHVRVQPDGKRLRERGLTALLGEVPDGRDAGRGERRRGERRRDDDLEERVIERLERMLKP
jgi:hypothetical protein